MKSKSFSNKPFDFVLLVIVFIMLALGIIMVMSASAPTSLAEEGNSYEYVKTQALSAVLGIIAMFIISKIDYRIFKKFDNIIYIGVIVLLAAVIFLGASSRGSKKMDKFRISKLSAIRDCKNRINYFLCLTFN